MKTLARSMAGVATTGLAFRQDPSTHTGARIAPAQVPRALRAFWTDGFFTAAQDAFILTYLPLLANTLGANATQIALLSASQSLGALLALYPGAIASRRASSRRWFVIFYTGILGRIALLLSALAVAFFSGQTALYLVIILFTARAFFGNFTLPAWTSLAADIIPEPLRARYFASRNFAINGATLALTPLGGFILDYWGFPGGFTIALAASFGLGMVATFAYSRIPDPKAKVRSEKRATPSMRPLVVLRNKKFRTFMLASLALQFSTQIAGPFFNVYLQDSIGASNFQIGWLVTGAALSGLAGQLLFGDMLARRGSLWVTRFSLLVIPILPFMWLFVDTPWLVLAPNLIGGAVWAGFYLANFQQMLEITEEDEREEYVAFFHMSMFLALFIAPFLGGIIVDFFGYKPAFVISGLGRFVSTAMFFLVVVAPKARVQAADVAAEATSVAA